MGGLFVVILYIITTVVVGASVRTPMPTRTAYGPSNEFYPVSAVRASFILSAGGESSAAVSTDNDSIIVAWDPEFRGPSMIPQALLWSHGYHDGNGARYWSVTDLKRNPGSRWTQHDLYRRQPRRLLTGLLDIAKDANATLNLKPIATQEPVLWLESAWMNNMD